MAMCLCWNPKEINEVKKTQTRKSENKIYRNSSRYYRGKFQKKNTSDGMENIGY